MFFPVNYLVNTFYDEASDAAAAKAASDAADVAAKAAAEAAKGNQTRTYSQEEYEKAIESEKQRAAESTRKAVTELETHKKNANLTQAEKDNLQKKIDEMNATIMTKEQLFKQDKEKLISTYESQVSNVTKERDDWKNRFVQSTVQRSITDAAIKMDAYDADVFLAILGPKTEVVEDRAADGTMKGYKVKVKLDSIDKDGNPITMDLDPVQAVKQLKDKPDTHGYLFKGHTSPGVGGSSSKLPNQADFTNMSITDYAKHRPALLGKK